MRRTGNAIELMKIIRHNATLDQTLEKRGKRVDPVVYASKQDRLTKKNDSGIGETMERIGHLVVNFCRVICLNHKNNGPTIGNNTGQTFNEISRYTFRH